MQIGKRRAGVPDSTSGEEMSLTDLVVGTAKGVASTIKDFTGGDDYGEPGHSELVLGEALAEPGLGNPAAFAHTVIDWYALATGDLLHGAAEISREGHNLAYSSAAVSRSACEYAQITRWLADSQISGKDRVARTAHLVLRSSKESRAFSTPEEYAEIETESRELLLWAQKNASSKQRLPGPTDRFKAFNPISGRWHYAYLSQLAHGDFFAVARINQYRTELQERYEIDRLWRIVVASAHVLDLVHELGRLRQRSSQDLSILEQSFTYTIETLTAIEDNLAVSTDG